MAWGNLFYVTKSFVYKVCSFNCLSVLHRIDMQDSRWHIYSIKLCCAKYTRSFLFPFLVLRLMWSSPSSSPRSPVRYGHIYAPERFAVGFERRMAFGVLRFRGNWDRVVRGLPVLHLRGPQVEQEDEPRGTKVHPQRSLGSFRQHREYQLIAHIFGRDVVDFWQLSRVQIEK